MLVMLSPDRSGRRRPGRAHRGPAGGRPGHAYGTVVVVVDLVRVVGEADALDWVCVEPTDAAASFDCAAG